MSVPDEVREVLNAIGQVAAEVPRPIDGYREFVSVSAGPRERVMNFERRFPYLADAQTLYRTIRFRVRSDLIQNDSNVGPDDLIELQQLYLPSEEDVEFVMRIWKVPTAELLSPRHVDIPV